MKIKAEIETQKIHTGIACLEYPVGEYILNNKNKIIDMAQAFAVIDEFKNEGLNLICRGSSGAIIATIFAMILPNMSTIVHIKKEGESAHSSALILNYGYKNIIVDDMICTGETLNIIYDKLNSSYMFSLKTPIIIDCVCVSGADSSRFLKFKPRYFMSK